MESPSKNSLSLRKKPDEPAPRTGALGKRQQQSHTRAQRQDFLAAVARLGTVAEAAQELGINRSTCQKWANAAGIRPQRQYSQADKGHVYAVLDRTGSITGAAQELGLNISTAHNWTGKVNPAGKNPWATRTGKPAPAQRLGFAVALLSSFGLDEGPVAGRERRFPVLVLTDVAPGGLVDSVDHSSGKNQTPRILR